jgi:CheY-like chemotaxis protein
MFSEFRRSTSLGLRWSSSALSGARLVSRTPSIPCGPVRRILVVDDDPDILQLNADLLERSGYEVATAADGDAALEALDSDCYDLLLTDHSMPKITGLELIKKLRAAHNAVPVILVSGMMRRRS